MTINVDDFDVAPDPWVLPDDDRPRHPVDRSQLGPRPPHAGPVTSIVAASSPPLTHTSGARSGARKAVLAKLVPGKGKPAERPSSGTTAARASGQAASVSPVAGAAARAKPAPARKLETARKAEPPKPARPAKGKP
jgi:hypothetical protein